MVDNPLKFNALNEEEKANNEQKSNKIEITSELLDKALNALKKNRLDDESIEQVAKTIFGEDGYILITSNEDITTKHAEKFIEKAKKYLLTQKKDSSSDDIEENESYEYFTPYSLITEADEKANLAAKIKSFITVLFDKIMSKNEFAKKNKLLKSFKAKLPASKKNDKDKYKAKSLGYQRPQTLEDLKRTYKELGKNFIAHTCTMTYKLLDNTDDKEKALADVAKNLTKDNDDSDKYLSQIKDINERKIIDAGAFALALAKKKQETKSGKSPQAAKTTKEALQLAKQYKQAYPKYYQTAMNLIDDSYKEGIAEAQKDLKEGKKLIDPITGEEVSYEVIAPLWKAGSKLNDFFMKEPLNVVTLFPKLIFGTFNLLTSDTAKDIYKGLFKFGRAIAQKVSSREQQKSFTDNSALFNCDVDTLTKEFESQLSDTSSEENEETESADEQKRQ